MEEVTFNQKALIKIDDKVINELKEKAARNESGKYRLCLQHSPQDLLHEMFIVRRKGDYGRPDKHLHTTESHTIIDGAMLVILFEDDGNIKEIFKLSKECFHTYRIDTDIYHMQIPLTEQVVYYEIKSGPFTEETNIFPEWAPKASDSEKVEVFMKDLEKKIDKFKENNVL
ncbi:MAG: WbuC family cupin fold metalloprotein [Ruminococcus flavefaciens]|nr:WbuC family cupin fold metalloprotein [Ruminococcus flavefaciens]